MKESLRSGSPAKRAAIVRAALEVFVRDGYARASVDAIATAAGVSKRTIYDYYGDKERLFLRAIRETRQAQTAAFEDLLDRTLGRVDDIEAALTAFGREFAVAISRSTDRAAVLRLTIAEAAHFPALLEPDEPSVQGLLADRLAGLAADGLLDVADPTEAAEFLGLLVTGRANNHSWYGSVPLADAEIARLADGGVRLFLRAYRRA
ncbi:TetR/AcrR family transcriptional regulator [Asanoa sp. NPDC050611]|uniref:TetR/AcrR family transcriptional regulator n=1 Tax=Asanoa sp. NPDC050611 TaxID=3157098 RepID=UPI00340CE684